MSSTEDFGDRTGLEVAVVGMTGRLPGAADLEEFWRNLRDGVESVSYFTDEELAASGLTPEQFRRPDYVRARGVVGGVELFDAAYFGYTRREAELIDPQQRIFLECAAAALDDAGYDPDTYKGAVGVFGGVGLDSYLLFNLYGHRELIESVGLFHVIMANHKDSLATRVSYKLNLRGPSVTMQTACSTSLVAVHFACQSLLSGDCDMALAGGVSITTPEKTGYVYQDGGILSPDGHCRAFDARAEGTISSNGVGVVVLKKLEDALADGDHIRAVIKGSAVNNDGSVKVGYTAPSVQAQAQVIRTAQGLAEVEPETITYVEAHGTGTALGDPVEVAALQLAFGAAGGKKHRCAIGSLKSNIGHLDTAAGVAGLIKTVLALEHKELPPSLHFESPNPQINFSDGPFYVNSRLAAWESDGRPRRAGVSSFGIGGTNAHVILEEAPPRAEAPSPRSAHLLVLSARTETALEAATTNLLQHLKRRPDASLADVAYTLQVGRRTFGHRRALVARDAADAVEALEKRDPKRVLTRSREAGKRPVAFMFPGQGTQHVNMGRRLYEEEPLFRERVDECCRLLEPSLGLDLRGVLYPAPGGEEEATRLLGQTWLTQPALFAVEHALARLWMEWGVKPDAMIGHSVGEYVAACLAGVFTLEDALSLVAKRGRLIQSLPAGSMLAVQLAPDELLARMDGRLSIAAVNAEALCVVAGEAGQVSALEAELTGQGVVCQPLHTSHAFHSEMMEPAVEAFRAEVARVERNPPRVPFVSNVTGRWIEAGEAQSPEYWATHMRRTVRFADGARELLSEPERVFLEVGPGRTLGGLVERHPAKAGGHDVLSSLPHPKDRHSDAEHFLGALGKLWLAGAPVEWAKRYAGEGRRRLPLPPYPFERQRYWIDPVSAGPAAQPEAEPAAAPQPGLGAGNGHAAQPAQAAPHSEGFAVEPELEEVLRRQLQVLSGQLEILRDYDFTE